MKRIIYLSVLFLVLTACNSEKYYPTVITMGETKDMTIIEFDYTFKGVWVGSGEVNTRNHSFDANGDGKNDFKLISSVDTVQNSVENSNVYYYTTYIELLNGYGAMKMQESPNEVFYTGTIRDTLLPGQSWPSQYTLGSYSCTETINSNNVGYNYGYVNRVNSGVEVVNEYNGWSSNSYDRKLISHTNYEIYSSNNRIIYNFSCLNPTVGVPFFIPLKFSGNNSSADYMGWIELEILDDNTIHLIRTAIQE